jgi:hypothetical protein
MTQSNDMARYLPDSIRDVMNEMDDRFCLSLDESIFFTLNIFREFPDAER